KAVAAVINRSGTASPELRLAAAGQGTSAGTQLLMTALMKGHVMAYLTPQDGTCANRPNGQHPQPGVDSPMDGDPVNLATGEEEFQDGPDLTVYNPVGPTVV